MGTRDENGSLKAVQLTVDLKPNLPRTIPSLYFLLIGFRVIELLLLTCAYFGTCFDTFGAVAID